MCVCSAILLQGERTYSTPWNHILGSDTTVERTVSALAPLTYTDRVKYACLFPLSAQTNGRSYWSYYTTATYLIYPHDQTPTHLRTHLGECIKTSISHQVSRSQSTHPPTTPTAGAYLGTDTPENVPKTFRKRKTTTALGFQESLRLLDPCLRRKLSTHTLWRHVGT